MCTENRIGKTGQYIKIRNCLLPFWGLKFKTKVPAGVCFQDGAL